MSPSEMRTAEMGGRAGQDLLQRLARTHNVGAFLRLAHQLRFLRPQLFLHRKFEKVRIVKVRKREEEKRIRLEITAKSFPYPIFQWLRDGVPIPNADGPHHIVSVDESKEGVLLRCEECGESGEYSCRVYNEVGDGEPWSDHYRHSPSGYHSSLTSPSLHIDLQSQKCVEEAVVERVRSALVTAEVNPPSAGPDSDHDDEPCTATDKVALIIGNAEYRELPRLITPPCDAAALAAGLVALGFKTVTLVDLALNDLKRIVQEYRRLLGEGVYAVLYFVGHGLEAGGKCYLLPVDAPGRDYLPDHCVSVDWLRAQMQGCRPALNLILLDMCRKYPPNNLEKFTAADDGPIVPPSRNTVLGFATSCGVGAYEVRGEVNGVFMKYLKKYVALDKPVTTILDRVLRDLELDEKASDVQFPEVRKNLSRPRKLTDPITFSGHTASFNHRTLEWQQIHQLPDPLSISLPGAEFHGLRVVIWFDFTGHFTNLVYVFTSVVEVSETGEEAGEQTERARRYLAELSFPPDLEARSRRLCSEMEEGISVRCLLRGLHRLSGRIPSNLALKENEEIKVELPVLLGPVLITRLSPDD